MSCNIIKEYTSFSKKNMTEYTKMIMGKYYDKELFEKYIDKYISVRYNHSLKDVKPTMEDNITYYLKEVYDQNETPTSKFIFELIKILYYLDDVKIFESTQEETKYYEDLDQIRNEKLDFFDENFINEFKDKVKDNEKRKKKFLESFDTKSFSLNLDKISRKEIYDVKIDYNIEIPKLYSDYAINRVYNNGIVNEDKIQIEYYLVSKLILLDLIDGKHNKEYLLDFAVSLFEKKQKEKQVFSILDSDIVKELVSLKITYEDYTKYKDEIYGYMREGYNFTLLLKDSNKISNKELLDVFKYVVVDKNNTSLEGIKNLLVKK